MRTYEGLMKGTKYGSMITPGSWLESNLLAVIDRRTAPGKDQARKSGIRGSENNDNENTDANARAALCGQGNSKATTNKSTTPVRNQGIGIRARAKTTWRMSSARRSAANISRRRSAIIGFARRAMLFEVSSFR